mmetsp:Transcript_41082/g.89769  ORF Transcript_41082/g.89769 Transcript_41082/m.89769 type:complete len:291 (-) Transcript_41082:574-1446(-)
MSKHREGQVAEGLRERQAMVGLLWLGQRGILLGHFLPGKLPGVDDHAPESTALPRDELCGAVHYKISSKLHGTAQVRCGQCVVHNKRHLNSTCQLCQSTQIAHHAARIGQALDEKEPSRGVGQGNLDLLKVADVDEGALPVELLNRLPKLRNASSIKLVGGHDRVSRLHQTKEGQHLSSVARGCAGGSATTLHVCQSLLQGCNCRVGDPAIDVSKGGEVEERCSVIDAIEDIGGVLVDGDHACPCRGVGSCACMNRAGFKASKDRSLPDWLNRRAAGRRSHGPLLRGDDA